MDLHSVVTFLNAERLRGEAAVLVTVCAVQGSSMRNPGTIMGVAADGRFAGSLSGGCIENAVIGEALDALKVGIPRLVRYGVGSPYLDIRLPCGGGLDVHFCVLGDKDDETIARCLASLKARAPFSLEIGPKGARFIPEWRPDRFDPASATGTFGHWPSPRLSIIGHGATLEALAMQSRALGCEVATLTPDERMIDALKAQGFTPGRLKRRTQTDALESDPWTAFVFLFHDHDWEIDLMERALALPHFYIGAMGGRQAHALRCEALFTRGVRQEKLDTIKAPIGVFHSSRDPHTLALSTLAEVIRTYQDADFETTLG